MQLMRILTLASALLCSSITLAQAPGSAPQARTPAAAGLATSVLAAKTLDLTVLFMSERGSFDSNSRLTDASGQAAVALTVTREDLQGIPANATFRVSARVTAEGRTLFDSLDLTVLGDP